MISNPDLKISDGGRKIVAAGRGIGIVKPKRFPQITQPVARDGPVGNVVMDLLWVHVVHILKVRASAQLGACTVELTCLVDHIPDGVVPAVFTHSGAHAIHND